MTYRGRQQLQPGPVSCRLLFILVFLSVAFMSCRQCLAETTASASLHPTRFTVETEAALTVTVKGSRSADVQLPTVAGLSFQGRGKSTQIQIINGSLSSTVSFAFLVQAEHPGTYTIPALRVSVDGSTLMTQPITVEVIPAAGNPSGQGGTVASPSPAGADPDAMAFLHISGLKQTAWTGEVIPLQIKAYFRQGVKVNLNTLPVLKGEDLVMPQLDQQPPQTEETIKGTAYSVLTWESSVAAAKDGKHTLAVELEATLLLPHRRTPFSGFGDQDLSADEPFQDMFGGFKSKNIKMASRPMTIETKQLPTAETSSSGFSGAIGHFNLSVEAKPTTVEVGDPITLTMTVSGTGNFDRVAPPTFPGDQQWKTYPPSAEFKPGAGPTQGAKHFEQAIVVKDEHVAEIPPVSFVFFDPATEKYVSLTSPPIPLSVKSSRPEEAGAQSFPASPVPEPAAPKAVAPENPAVAGLAPLHPHMGNLQKEIVPLYAKAWFILLLALSTLVLLATFSWKAWLLYLQNHPEVLRNKEWKALLAKNLARMKEAADTNDSRQYLEACRKAIQELLGHRWQIEPSTITLADLQARLPQSPNLIALFAAAEQGVFANYPHAAAQRGQDSAQIEKELGELP